MQWGTVNGMAAATQYLAPEQWLDWKALAPGAVVRVSGKPSAA